ncbi:LytTR family DNA-binding domain-containing protein [uncultured Cohaesibacter sp.]|uniref:LytR/AlgR family response regulator transcription factor n=1 Tax=uncultured Cohaesibacter sp. TaxID=1002546 RepID=UPI0029C7365B|nr:LytTR family DNA-binding domain-containing protein [uncultured Cohaesibacter sp.]
MQIKCLIVDDEKPARDELSYLLSRQQDIDILAEADSAQDAISLSLAHEPDLVFLDIQMAGQNGFDVIRNLVPRIEKAPIFVFVTAYDSYAVEAFEASAMDYILKPVSEERLASTLDRVRKMHAETEDPLKQKLDMLLAQVGRQKQVIDKPAPTYTKVSILTNGRIRLMDPDDIIYCDCEDNRVFAHTYDAILPVYGIASMDRMEEHLANTAFFRAHRSTLVNLDAISEFSPWFNGKYSLTMNDQQKSELTVSRSRVKDFKLRLGL